MGLLRRTLFGLFTTQETISEEDMRRGTRLLMVDAVGAISMATLTGGPFLAAFAIALGASNYEVGLIASIGFVGLFMQIAGLYLVRKVPRRRAITVLSAGAARLLWIFIILIPLFFRDRGVTFLMQWLLIAAVMGSVPGPAWNSLLRDIVPPDAMGRIFSRRLVLGTIFALGLTLGGGWFVDWWRAAFPEHALYGYSILFAVGLVFGLAGVLAIAGLPEPTMKVEGDESIVDLLVRPVKDANFRKLLGFILVWNFAVNMAGPFFIIYMMRRLGISVFMVTVLAVTSQATNVVFLRIWGRLADRFSNKSVLAVSGPLFLLAILGWTFTTMPEKHFLTLPLLFGIHVLSGMSLAGVGFTSASIALKLSPRGEAHSYVTVYGIAGAITGAIAPLAAGLLGDVFAARRLAIPIQWTEPAGERSVYALNFQGLDFVFVIAFLVGLYAMRRLAKIREEGEVEEDEVRSELLAEIGTPFRIIATIPGVRHIVAIPVSAIYRFAKSLGTRAEDGTAKSESCVELGEGAAESHREETG